MRGLTSIKNLILVIAASLILLTACVPDAGAIVAPDGTSSMSEAVTNAGTNAEDSTNAHPSGEILLRPLTYQVDVSHDEVPEILTVSQTGSGDSTRTEVTLVQDGVTLWAGDLDLTDGLTRKAYFLCTLGDEDFLAVYRAYLEDGSYRYTMELFDLEGGALRHVDNRTFLFGINSANGHPVDPEGLGKFAKWMNWYLNRSILLCINDGGAHSYSTQEVQRRYEETFSDIFLPAEDYSDCATVEEKAERYNALHDQIEGIESLELTKPEGFDEIAAEMMAENKSALVLGEELSVDREFWYMEYKDWAIQVIRDDPAYSTPIMTTDTVYYYAKEDKTLDEIVVTMLEALVAEATVESEHRTYVVNEFRIPTQKLVDADDASELCLEAWHQAEPSMQANVRAFVRDWLLYNSADAGFLPIGEEMWYFVPEGYFSYSGEIDGQTLEEAMAEAPETVVGGKVPLLAEDSEEEVVLVLMKQGNVYRLQSLEGMQRTYEKLQSAEATAQAEDEEE